jgi:outer membrane biosynthesis protein TonB
MFKIGKGISGLGKKTGMFENFVEKLEEKRVLKELSKKKALSAADDIADVAVPLYSAGKKALKGDYAGAAKDAAIDVAATVAAPFTGGASLAARTAAKTASKVGERAFVKGRKVKQPKNEPEVPTTKPTETRPSNKPSTKPEPAKPADKPKRLEPDKTPDTKPETVPATKPASKPSLAKRIGAGAAGALGVGALAAAAGSSGSGQPREKKFTKPGQFKLGAKISSAEKFDTEVARNRKRESQYDKSLTTSESVISQLYTIKESHNEGFINIDNNNVAINKIVAEKVINVFESLNEENQKKVSTMLNESVDSFKKIINLLIIYKTGIPGWFT